MRRECENSARSRLRNLAHIRTVIRGCLSSRARNSLAEINRGAALLQKITGTRPRFVAYPYGGEQDYSEDSCLAARAAALDAAFVNHGGAFRSGAPSVSRSPILRASSPGRRLSLLVASSHSYVIGPAEFAQIVRPGLRVARGRRGEPVWSFSTSRTSSVHAYHGARYRGSCDF